MAEIKIFKRVNIRFTEFRPDLLEAHLNQVGVLWPLTRIDAQQIHQEKIELRRDVGTLEANRFGRALFVLFKNLRE